MLMIINSFSCFSQSYSDAFSINIGVVQDGFAGLANYNYFLDRHDFIDAGLLLTSASYQYKDQIKIPYNDFTFNAGYSKNVYFNQRNTFNANIGGGGVFGYETLNNGDKKLPNGALILSESSFIYGAYIGLDLDYVITDSFSLSIKANQYYHANSSIGQFVPFIGIGTRIYLN